MKQFKWKLNDVIMVGIISVVFALIYLAFVYFGRFLAVLLTPFGLAPFANELIFGVWFMAATLATYIMRKPGVALISEMLAALIEVMLGNFYGPMVFISGFIQGLGAELGFAVFGYRRYDRISLSLAAIMSALFSFIWGLYRSSFAGISTAMIASMFLVRCLSAVVFSSLCVGIIGKHLKQSGVVNSYPIANHDA